MKIGQKRHTTIAILDCSPIPKNTTNTGSSATQQQIAEEQQHRFEELLNDADIPDSDPQTDTGDEADRERWARCTLGAISLGQRSVGRSVDQGR